MTGPSDHQPVGSEDPDQQRPHQQAGHAHDQQHGQHFQATAHSRAQPNSSVRRVLTESSLFAGRWTAGREARLSPSDDPVANTSASAPRRLCPARLAWAGRAPFDECHPALALRRRPPVVLARRWRSQGSKARSPAYPLPRDRRWPSLASPLRMCARLAHSRGRVSRLVPLPISPPGAPGNHPHARPRLLYCAFAFTPRSSARLDTSPG